MSELSFRLSTSSEPAAVYLAGVLLERLQQGQRVLWLVSGGSAIDVAVKVARKLQNIDLQNLTVTLADERFGPVGHTDSNWQQLQKMGFSLPGAQLVSVLKGMELQPTTTLFGATLGRLFNGADYRLALLGIGADGHTAGILPGTAAVTAMGMATGYVTPQYKRVSMTLSALGQLDEVVVYEMGEAKRAALELLKQDVPVAEQPAQAFKTVSKVTIFNDQIGEAVT